MPRDNDRGVSLRAVVGGLVPGRGTGWWRLRRAADLLGENGARRCAWRRSSSRWRTTRVRPWPWIITGLATVILYPDGVMVNGVRDHEAAYVQAFVDLLPTPWRGFMMAGFAAAYMSTVATQLNWGASYLVNDFYRRFLRKTATERHYVNVSRWATVVLFLLSIIVTSQLATVEQGVEVSHRPRRGHGPRLHPALVLVAHQCVERDQRDDRVVRDVRLCSGDRRLNHRIASRRVILVRRL